MSLTRRKTLTMMALASAGAAGCASIAPKDSLDTALGAVVEDPQYPLAGLSVLVMRQGRVVHEAQFGRRHVEPDLSVTRDTFFRVASVSKIALGLGVLRLVEAGKLDLDADVSEHLGFKLRNPNFPAIAITARLLLSHLSSLTDAGGLYLEAGKTLQSALVPGGAHFGKGQSWDSRNPPGRYFQYCNLGSGVLASVIERASGQRFDRYMQQQVLAPLGMQGAYDAAQLTGYQLAQVATLYRKQGKDEVWNAAGPWTPQADDFIAQPPQPIAGLDGYELGSNGSLFGPQGRLRTRVQDLGRMMAMLASGGVAEGGARFLKRETVAAMCTERWRHDAAAKNGDPFAGLFGAWGLGLQHFHQRRAWGHLGFSYGLQAALMFSPETGNGFIYVLSGHAADPWKTRGRHSPSPLWEERLQDLLMDAST